MSADAYKLRLDRPLDHEIERLFRSQVNRARRAARKPDDDSIHTARKRPLDGVAAPAPAYRPLVSVSTPV